MGSCDLIQAHNVRLAFYLYGASLSALLFTLRASLSLSLSLSLHVRNQGSVHTQAMAEKVIFLTLPLSFPLSALSLSLSLHDLHGTELRVFVSMDVNLWWLITNLFALLLKLKGVMEQEYVLKFIYSCLSLGICPSRISESNCATASMLHHLS